MSEPHPLKQPLARPPVSAQVIAPVVAAPKTAAAVSAPASGGSSGGQAYSPSDFAEQFNAPLTMTLEAILLASQPDAKPAQQEAGEQTEKNQMRIQIEASNTKEPTKPTANAQQRLLEKIIALQSKNSRGDNRGIGLDMNE